MINIVITGRVPSKKNSKRIVTRGKRAFLIGSQDYLDWKSVAKQQISSQLKKDFIKFVEPVSIQIDVYFPDRRKADITNKVESIMDAMVDEGVIEDDKWQCVPELILTGQYDKENPRVVIRIKNI